MKKTLIAALGATLALALAACSAPVGTTSPSPTATSTDPAAPTVDRDPQGTLPTITFDDDGIPSMATVTADPPTVISAKTLRAGDGATVAADDFVTANYAGFLWQDGSEFDSSFGTGQPAGFLLQDVVPGWRYGLAGTRVGDRVLLVVPPEYGYGDTEDESVPADSTLVFVVDVLSTTGVNTDALTAATPTGAALPAGLSIQGELGQEPSLVFTADAPEPSEPQIIVLAEGTGQEVAETDHLLYHVVIGYWGEQVYSSWTDSYQQADSGGGPETVGQRVGSRLLLVYPADEENEIGAQALVLDLVAAVAA